eukprot:3543032-Rhodomonas_salina.1
MARTKTTGDVQTQNEPNVTSIPLPVHLLLSLPFLLLLSPSSCFSSFPPSSPPSSSLLQLVLLPPPSPLLHTIPPPLPRLPLPPGTGTGSQQLGPALVLILPTVLRIRYAMSGSDMGYCTTVLRIRYAISGTDRGYCATAMLCATYEISGTAVGVQSGEINGDKAESPYDLHQQGGFMQLILASKLSAYARAMGCPVLAYRMLL